MGGGVRVHRFLLHLSNAALDVGIRRVAAVVVVFDCGARLPQQVDAVAATGVQVLVHSLHLHPLPVPHGLLVVVVRVVMVMVAEGRADLAQLDEVEARGLGAGMLLLLLHTLEAAVQGGRTYTSVFLHHGRGDEGAHGRRQARRAERRVQGVRGRLRRQGAGSVGASTLSVARPRADGDAVVVVVVVATVMVLSLHWHGVFC